MFKVEVNGKLYEVQFVHYSNDKQTHCNVLDGETVVVTGIAQCAPQDNFSRATGRKVSLARALRSFDRDTRTKFWEVYFSKTNKK